MTTTCATCGTRANGARYCSEACYDYHFPPRPKPSYTLTRGIATGDDTRACIFVSPNQRGPRGYIRPSRDLMAGDPFFAVTTSYTAQDRTYTDASRFRQRAHAEAWLALLTS